MAGFRCPNCATAQTIEAVERAAGRVVCRTCGAAVSLAVQDPLGVGRRDGGEIDLPAPKPRDRHDNLPAPRGHVPMAPHAPMPPAAPMTDVENLPVPVGRHQHRYPQDLPAPRSGPPPLPQRPGVSGLPAPKGAPPLPAFDNLPAPKGGLPDLLAPVGQRPLPNHAYDNLPVPVGARPTGNLPAPKGFFDDALAPRGAGATLGAAGNLPAPKGYFDNAVAPVAGNMPMGSDLPAPKGYFDDALAPHHQSQMPGAANLPAPKGYFDDGLAPQHPGQGAGSLPAPLGYFDDAVAPLGGDPFQGGGNLPAPKGIFDDLASPQTLGGAAELAGSMPHGGSHEPFDLGEPLDLGGFGSLGDAPSGAPPLDLGGPARGGSALDLGHFDSGRGADSIPPIELSTGTTSPPPLDLGGPQRPFGLDDLQLEAPSTGIPDMPRAGSSGFEELALPGSPSLEPANDGVVSFSTPSDSAVAAGQQGLARRRPVEEGPLELDQAPLPMERDVQASRTLAGERRIGASMAPPKLGRRKLTLALVAVLGVAGIGGGGYYGYDKYSTAKNKEEAVSRALTRARNALAADRPGHWAEAAEASQTAISADSESTDAHALAAQAYFGSVIDEGLNQQANIGLGKKSTGALRQLAAKGAEVFKADALQAIAERRAGDALGKLTQARAANRRDASIDLYFGWAHMLKRDHANAESSFTAALASSPDRVPALYGLARAQQEQGKDEEAHATYLKVIEKSRERYQREHVGALVGAAQLAGAERFTDRENRYLEILARGDLSQADPRAISRAWTLAGDEALRAGRVQEANQRYAKALEHDGQNLAAVVGEGNTLIALGRPGAARERLMQVLNVDPTDLDAALALAEVALIEENLTECKSLLNKIFEHQPPIDSKPILARARRILAGALALEPDSDEEAEAEFRQAIKLSGPRDATAALALARFYVGRNRGEEARAVLDPLSTRAQNDPSIAVSLGVAYLGAKDPVSAEKSFRMALEKRPGDVEARFQLGQALLAQKRTDEGLAAIKAAYDTNRSREDIGLALAVAYEERKRFSDAVALYESLLGAEDPSLNVRARAGRYFARHDNEARAIALGEEILAQQPNHPAGLFLLGEKFFAANAFDKALRSYMDAAALEMEPQYFEGAGRASERLQLFDDALRHYQKTISLDDEYLSAHLGMARIHVARREFRDSIKVVSKALELDPRNAWAHFAAGTSYLELRSLDKAADSLTLAVRFDPELIEAHYKLGRTYYDLDKTRQAAVALSRATTKANGDEEWLTEAHRLEAYAHKQSGNSRAAIKAFRAYFDREPAKGPVRADAKRELLYLEGGGR